jgi:hypothetical protein
MQQQQEQQQVLEASNMRQGHKEGGAVVVTGSASFNLCSLTPACSNSKSSSSILFEGTSSITQGRQRSLTYSSCRGMVA